MDPRYSDYVESDPQKQVVMLQAALNLPDREEANHAVRTIILTHNRANVSSQEEAEGAREMMLMIIDVLRKAGKQRVPDRGIFSIGSVAYDHVDTDVRKAAADLLVEWALPTPPPQRD